MIVALLALCPVVLADDPIVYLVRISLAEGEVSYHRANDPNTDWFDVTNNTPLDQSDQIYSGPNGRAEIQLLGRNVVRISHDTHLSLTKLDPGTMQFALSIGTATFRVASLDRRQFQIVDASQAANNDPVYFEVDTPTIAVTLLKEGEYRINVKENGATEVIVRNGQAEVYNQDLGSIVVKQGRLIVVDASAPSVYQMQVARADSKDDWDLWNEDRDRLMPTSVASSQYVPSWIPGSYDLDRYGTWWSTPDYGYVWFPSDIGYGWAPYQAGNWYWYPSFGWTWISYDPWGWVPYHYGRWAFYQNRWCWLPHSGFAYSPSIWSWSPALVTFVSYDHGFHNGRYGWVGWVPLGPGEARPARTIATGHPGGLVPGRTSPIRSIESLRNYSAPGGLIGIDGGRFASRRVVVNNTTAAPAGRENAGRGLVVNPSGDENLRPTEKQPSRRLDPVVARSLSAPIVTRSVRSRSPWTFSPAPAGTSAPNATRTTRVPDFRPAERSVPPPTTRSATGVRPNNGDQGQSSTPRVAPRVITTPPPASTSSGRTERTVITDPGRNNNPRNIERRDNGASRPSGGSGNAGPPPTSRSIHAEAPKAAPARESGTTTRSVERPQNNSGSGSNSGSGRSTESRSSGSSGTSRKP